MMIWMKLLFLAGLLCHIVTSFPAVDTDNPVLMISFDGFRHDYLDMVKARGLKTPNFDLLIRNGVKAEYMKNVFITKTFPNHYTLVTGMYEESHGVVSNNMFDPKYNETFSLKLSDHPSKGLNKWFTNDTTSMSEGPEPVWVTNQKGEQKGKTRRSGVIMWPGSTATVHNFAPDRLISYNKSFPYRTRVDHMVEWLTCEKDPINLGLLYFSEPDHTGHQEGPNSAEVADVIVEMDGILGYLINSLNAHGLLNKLNMIITSDHGMMEIRNITALEDYGITSDMYSAYGSTPVLSVLPKEGYTVDELVDKFKNVSHITVYRKEEIPRKFYYTYNRRILPILIVADDHWQICQENNCNLTVGNHGYSNDDDAMHPIFIAHGPAFKRKDVVPAFNNVDVYPLLCKLLGLSPGPNNGSLQITGQMIQPEDGRLTVTGFTFLAAVVFAAIVSGMFCISALRSYSRRRRVTNRRLKLGIDNDGSPVENSTLLPADTEDDDEIA